MGDKIIITEDEGRPPPDTVIVMPVEKSAGTKSEKEVVVTEKTTVTKRVEN